MFINFQLQTLIYKNYLLIIKIINYYHHLLIPYTNKLYEHLSLVRVTSTSAIDKCQCEWQRRFKIWWLSNGLCNYCCTRGCSYEKPFLYYIAYLHTVHNLTSLLVSKYRVQRLVRLPISQYRFVEADLVQIKLASVAGYTYSRLGY